MIWTLPWIIELGFLCATTRKINQTAPKPLGKGRGLDYKQSPTWITQIRVCMWKLWCLEDGKIGEHFLDGILTFSSWNEMGRGMEIFKRRKREGKRVTNQPLPRQPTCGPRVAHVDRGMLSTCGTSGSHVATMVGLLANHAPHAHL